MTAHNCPLKAEIVNYATYGGIVNISFPNILKFEIRNANRNLKEVLKNSVTFLLIFGSFMADTRSTSEIRAEMMYSCASNIL
jgi:hypothetical protein